MPLYKYRCACGKEYSKIHAMSDSPEYQCKVCGGVLRKIVVGGSGAYIKAITIGKYQKEERVRKKRRAEMSVRQYERYGGKNKLIPNIEGKELGSWKEAEEIAKQKGLKDTSKFAKYKDEEEHSKNSAGIDERRLKDLKEKAKQIH